MRGATDDRAAGDVLPRSRTPSLGGAWLAARLAALALVLWAVIGVLRTTFAVGWYEHRITVVTHGNADIVPALLMYELLDELLPWGRAATVVGWAWALGCLAAVAGFAGWLYRARRHAGRQGAQPQAGQRSAALAWSPGWAIGGWLIPFANLVIPYLVVRDLGRASGLPPGIVSRWWASVLATLSLIELGWLYGVATSDGGLIEGSWLDTRPVAYPLWISATAMMLVTMSLSARLVRRITGGEAAAEPAHSR